MSSLSNTGRPFRLLQTSRLHQNKGCVLVHGPHTKTEILFWCQWEIWINLNWSPCIYPSEEHTCNLPDSGLELFQGVEDHILHDVIILVQRGGETNVEALYSDPPRFDGVNCLLQVFYALCKLRALIWGISCRMWPPPEQPRYVGAFQYSANSWSIKQISSPWAKFFFRVNTAIPM